MHGARAIAAKTTQVPPPASFVPVEALLGGRDVLALLGQVAVHHQPAAAAQLAAVLDHAGSDRGDVRDLGTAELERIAGAHLLRFGAEREALTRRQGRN